MKQSRQSCRTRAQREAILGEFLESGLSQREFCEERRIGLSTLQHWLRKTRELEDSEEAVEPISLVELKVDRGRGISCPGRCQPQAEYDLVLLSGRHLVVRSGYDHSEVAALIRLLEQR